MTMFLVYKVQNVLNGKVYVGKTCDLDRRKVEHFSEAARDRRNTHLYNAIRRYGKSNFTFFVLAEFTREADAYEAETYFIALFHSIDQRVGYNHTLGGEGVRYTPEGKEVLSQLAKARTGPKNNFFGRKHTPQAKARMSKSREPYVGVNHPRWGMTHSEESRQKISAAKKGWHMGEAQRQQVSLRHAGERSSTAKVTNAQAQEIRCKRSLGVSVPNLQAEYGLSRSSVYKILAGKTFKELES